MRKSLNRMILLIIALLLSVSAASASNFLGKLSLSLDAAGTLSLDGNYAQSLKLNDIVNFGPGFDLGLRYDISKNFVLEADYRYSWLPLKQDRRPYAFRDMSPAFVLSMFMLNGTLFLRSDYNIEPFFTLGCGLCPWRFSEDGPTGETWKAPYNTEQFFSKTSFGFNAGIGLEISIWSHVSATVGVRYYYVFTRDVEKFGTDNFGQQDFLGINIGISYRLGKRSEA